MYANTPRKNTRAARIRRARSLRRTAFTLIELMVAVLIIGILLNISMPSIIRAREAARSKSCIANLKQIDTAKEQYAIDKRVTTGASPTAADLYGTGNYIRATPSCPTSGTAGYTINPIGTAPACVVGANLNSGTWDDHVLQ